jgi:hypothetical protein
MWTSHIASNMNFPAPLAVMGFLAAAAGLFAALAGALIAWFARKPKFARLLLLAAGAGAAAYFGLLLGFSFGSHSTTLARGQEKYFCEIDCHLAYSIIDVKTDPQPAVTRYVVILRTRFDETTTSPTRPKDVPLTPSPRVVRLLDGNGREYVPSAVQGTPLLTPLKPADSYTTQLEFEIPRERSTDKDRGEDAGSLRLLLNTTPALPDHLVIGDENSLLHKKTFFAL